MRKTIEEREAAMIDACPYPLDHHNRQNPGEYIVGIEIDANDDDACDAVLADVRAAIGRGWRVGWTGDGCGDKSDLSITWVGRPRRAKL
jgi:hypothetical protein